MKKLSVFFLAFVLCFCTFFNVYSINIDGYDKGAEWDGAETQIILNGESNCKVDFGLIKWIVDAEINTIYLCIMFKEPDIQSDNLNAGVSIQIDNSDPFIVSTDSSPTQFDIEKYYFDGAVKIDENGGITCEVRIGLKHGLPKIINGKLRFYDSDGSPSNVYDFTIENTEVTTGNHNAYDDEYDEKHTSASSEKTTSKKQNKTTTKLKETTTSKKNNSNEVKVDYDFLDFLFSSETTVKTTSNTTKPKQTAADKKLGKNKSNKKDIAKNEEITEEAESLSFTEASAAETTVQNTALTEQTRIKTSAAELDTYKIITLVAGGISLVAISVLGTLKSKKENTNENDRNS